MIPISNWFSRNTVNILVASVLGLSLLVGCADKNKRNEKNSEKSYDQGLSKAMVISKISDPTLKAHSISGIIGISVNPSNDLKGFRPVANLPVRVFQWHPKEGAEAYDYKKHYENKDQAAINAQYGKWVLAGETTTDSKGYYAVEGKLTPGLATFVEVLSVCRPTNTKLPITAIIADVEMSTKTRAKERNTGNWVGHETCCATCPEGTVCTSNDDEGVGCQYSYQVPSKLTKDDRIFFVFRRCLTHNDEVFRSSVPSPPTALYDDYDQGDDLQKIVYDGKVNPVLNITLKEYATAVIVPENWYSLTSYTIPDYADDYLEVGTSILDIIEYINNVILPGCTGNDKNTLIDLHYYPDADLFSASDYDHRPMSTGFTQYADTSAHYHAFLSPDMHLKRAMGDCYPQRFKELLLNSGLYRKGAKKEFRDLDRESKKEDDDYDAESMRLTNCYK